MDTAIVEAARSGDRQAFAAVYDTYADPIHSFCVGVLHDRAEAADATQDTFLIAYQRLGSLRDASKLRSWLYAVARNECLRRVRERQRTVSAEDLGQPVDTAEAPEDTVARRELQELVWQAAEGLAPRDRAILDLNLRQGLDGQELADALGIERQHAYVLLSNLKSRMERGLGALLVARLGRDDCPELQSLLQDWDGHFTPLVRKRVARHVERCAACSEQKKRTVSPVALLAAVPIVPAPAALRNSVLAELGAPLSTGAQAASGSMSERSGFPPGIGGPWKPRVIALVAAVAIVAGGLGVFLAVRSEPEGKEGGGRPAAVRDTPATTIPKASATPARDFCTVAAEMQATMGGLGPGAPTLAAFRESLTYWRELAEVAPAEVAVDAAAYRDGVAALVARLEAAGWDPSAAAGSDAALEAAGDRLESYMRTVCHIG